MAIENQKFLQMLSALKKEEVKKFKDFVNSPIVTIKYKQQCIALLEELIKKANTVLDEYGKISYVFPEGMLEKITEDLYSDSKSGKKNLRQNLSYLCKHMESFIGSFANKDLVGEFMHRSILSKLFFLEFLTKRSLYTLFDQYYRKYFGQIFKMNKSEHTYNALKIMEQFRIDNLLVSRRSPKNIDLKKLTKLTEHYNILCEIKLKCSRANIAKLGPENQFEEEEIVAAKNMFRSDRWKKAIKEERLIELYYKMFLILIGDTSIDKIKKIFELILSIQEKAESKIDDEELIKLVRFLQNICLEKTRKGESTAYRNLLVNIYKYLDKVALLSPENKMTVRLYLNIVNEMAKTDNFEWGHTFVEKYKLHLPIKEREKISKIGQSLLFFEDKKYLDSINILDNPNMYFENDLMFENNRNILILKAFYESKQFNHLIPRIERYLVHLRRSRSLPTRFVSPNKQFLQYLKKIAKILSDTRLKGHSKEQLLKKINLVQDKIINSSKRIDNKVWLLSKIEEVKTTTKQ